MPLKSYVVVKDLYNPGEPQDRQIQSRKKFSKGQNQALLGKTHLFKISQKFYKYQAQGLD